MVSAALEKAKHRAAVNFSLAEKLNKLIGKAVDQNLMENAYVLVTPSAS